MLKKYYLSFFIFFIVLSNLTNGKEKTNYEKDVDKRIEKNISLSEKDPDGVIISLRKLRDESINAGYSDGANKCSILLMRILANIKNDYSQIIEESKKGLKIAKHTEDNFALSFHHMYRAIAYNNVGLIDLYFNEMNKALNYSNKVIDINDKNMLWASINLNLAVVYLEDKKDTANHKIFYEKSQLALNAVSDTSDQALFKSNLIAINHYQEGRKFLKLNQKDSAEIYYLKAHDIAKRIGFSLNNKLMIIHALSDFYFDKNEIDYSIKFAQEGLNYAKHFHNPQIKVQFYKLLHKSYLQKNQIDSSKFYLTLYSNSDRQTRLIMDSTTNKTFDHYASERNLIYKYNIQKIIFLSLLAIITIVLGIWYWSKINSKKIYKKYEAIILRIHEEKARSIESENNINKKNLKSKEASKISDETKILVLEKLDNFEKSNNFTQKDLNLGGLAHLLNTNTRYLSDIIKEYRDKNFNTYINELRIGYAIHKLCNDPQYRKYKIAYLANSAGFSSGAVFSTIFKNQTGMTPSYFINQLEKNYKDIPVSKEGLIPKKPTDNRE